MATLPPTSHAFWMASTQAPDFPELREDISCDVCVVGAGIAGMTAALALAQEGAKVVVLEAGTVGGGVTGHTTGKVTSLHGLIYDELQSKWGESGARTYAQGQQHALHHVRQTVDTLGIDCDLRTRAAYTYVSNPSDRSKIENEVDAARAAGLDAALVEETPLPYEIAAAIRVPDQSEFHARKYLLGLAEAFVAQRGRIFQHTMATGLSERSSPEVQVGDLRVRAANVVIASHMPYLDRGAFFVRLTAKRSYAIAVKATGPVPDGMFISAGKEPSRSVRATPAPDGGELLIIGGEGHNAGEKGDETPQRYENLARFAEEEFGATDITHRWSSQDLQPADGLPYVGKLTPVSSHVFVVAGFRKWGLTGGTAAALALVDRMQGRPSALADLLDSWRVTPRKSAIGLAKEGIKDSRHMVGDRLRPLRSGSIEDLAPGEGALMKHDGQTVAASRDLDGTLRAVSPVCTHLGCRVLFNRAERSWDCPCHGSRFAPDGGVLEGPATRPLINRLDPDKAS